MLKMSESVEEVREWRNEIQDHCKELGGIASADFWEWLHSESQKGLKGHNISLNSSSRSS